ncbi:MAG: hypothetical protein C4589_00085 [Peptococcaceae bacterium]|nr:MAG: hypothetical protein C4589_00085 [Peptococcaceae bacterium]
MWRCTKRGQGEGTIRKRKDGACEARVTAGVNPATGKQKQISKYFKKREEAKDWLAKAVHEQATGRFVDPDKITVGQWLDRWLNDYKKTKLRSTTWENYETMARVHIKPEIGYIPLQKLQAGDLQRLYNQKLKDKKSIATVYKIHQVINGTLRQALREQFVYRNVNEATELPPLKHKEISPLELEQAQKFLEVAEQERLYAAYLLEFGTGLRRGELLALRWQDVDLESGRIFVNQFKQKTAQS